VGLTYVGPIGPRVARTARADFSRSRPGRPARCRNPRTSWRAQLPANIIFGELGGRRPPDHHNERRPVHLRCRPGLVVPAVCCG